MFKNEKHQHCQTKKIDIGILAIFTCFKVDFKMIVEKFK